MIFKNNNRCELETSRVFIIHSVPVPVIVLEEKPFFFWAARAGPGGLRGEGPKGVLSGLWDNRGLLCGCTPGSHRSWVSSCLSTKGRNQFGNSIIPYRRAFVKAPLDGGSDAWSWENRFLGTWSLLRFSHALSGVPAFPCDFQRGFTLRQRSRLNVRFLLASRVRKSVF